MALKNLGLLVFKKVLFLLLGFNQVKHHYILGLIVTTTLPGISSLKIFIFMLQIEGKGRD